MNFFCNVTRLIYASMHPFPVLMLQDTRDEGLAAPRSTPKNLEDSKLIFQRLAHFHAASFYLAENVSEIGFNQRDWMDMIFLFFIRMTCFQNEYDFHQYTYNIFDNPAVIEMFYTDALRAFREVFSTWDEFTDSIDKVDNFIDNFCDYGRNCYVPNKLGRGYNVLNHGDLHLRNLLARVNEETKRWEKFQFVRKYLE